MEKRTLFADVILPLALPNLYTYRVPEIFNNQAKPFLRVVVPLGKKKKYTGIIHSIHESAPQSYEARYLESILDENPVIGESQMNLWEWISSYYMCGLGEVMQAALPAGLKLSSETKIQLYDRSFRDVAKDISDREYLILDALEKAGELTLPDIEKIAGIKTIFPLIKSLIDRRIIIAGEEMKERFKPKTEIFIRLADEFQGEKSLTGLLNQLKRASRQQEVILAYLSALHETGTKNIIALKRAEILKKSPGIQAALLQLVKKGIFISEEREISRLGGEDHVTTGIILSRDQEQAITEIRQNFKIKKTVLLHGATGSGKTEIYISLIQEQLDSGMQVLYLLPEIALTAQIINRLRLHFGKKVQVYHSKFSENERMEVWNAASSLNSEEGRIILGARSAVFLPFRKLGLIIIDEEHEITFKQSEPAPRYHARDTAIYLASISSARVLLGSATPSLESYFNAISGKYGLVSLTKRYGGAELPEILINNLKEDIKKRRMKGIFSPMLIKAMEESIETEGQIILFQNRRGFAPLIQCRRCQWVPTCVQCDISLTYHKSIHQLRCHYCGYSQNVPSCCPGCESTDLQMKGFGTEKIEEELSAILPEIPVMRMDLDTTRSKYAYQRMIEDFEKQRVKILIGTQMVTKGLDFDNVRLVGILSADAMLNYPDFRAHERSFQLISQVAGRAGRRKEKGMVIIQTWKPEHPILQWIQNNDYENFIKNELIEREKFGYPPFTRLISITLKHEQMQVLDEVAEIFAKQFRKSFGKRMLGPEYPPVMRVRNYYQKRILLKLERTDSPQKIKQKIKENNQIFFSENPLKQLRIVVDVDPMF